MSTPENEDKKGLLYKEGQKRAKTGKKEKQGTERKPKQKKTRAGRRPSPEGTRLLFAGTTSPMTCLGHGPTE